MSEIHFDGEPCCISLAFSTTASRMASLPTAVKPWREFSSFLKALLQMTSFELQYNSEIAASDSEY